MTTYGEIKATGDALGQAAFEQGARITDEDRFTLNHYSRWGSDGYPIVKRGRGWVVDHALLSGAGMFRTKRAASTAWEIIIAKLVRMKIIEAELMAVNS